MVSITMYEYHNAYLRDITTSQGFYGRSLGKINTAFDLYSKKT